MLPADFKKNVIMVFFSGAVTCLPYIKKYPCCSMVFKGEEPSGYLIITLGVGEAWAGGWEEGQ